MPTPLENVPAKGRLCLRIEDPGGVSPPMALSIRSRAAIAVLVGCGVIAEAAAGSPRLFFDRGDVGGIRQRMEDPRFAPLWAKILADAEAYCDPASPRYADPRNPCPLPRKDAGEGRSRQDALLVHSVGRMLTQRMEAIGFAYQVTGRESLGRHGAALLAATAGQFPVTNPIVARGFAGGRGDIMRGLAIGFDLLSDRLDDPQRRLVVAACADYLDRAVAEFNDGRLWWHKVHNYNGVNGGAAGCLALALGDAFPERHVAWVSECVKVVDRWLTSGFDAEGAYMEGVSYSGYGLSNTILLADALRRAGRDELFGHPTFGRLSEFYALSLLPGERVYDARNDSPYAGLGGVLLKLADARRSGLYKWLWENSGTENGFLRILWENGVPPTDPVSAAVPRSRHFEGRGLCIWRTGWTTNDVMFSIEAGPFLPVTHNQADKGHFTLYGLGHRWATDCGYANEHGPEGRGQAQAHSCVLIDGKGQALSGAGWGVNGAIARYEDRGRYGYALADCTEAYNRNSAGKPGVGVQHARRHAFFVHPHRGSPAYAVVMDDLRKDDRPHEFTWQMMFSDRLRATLADGRAVLTPLGTSGDAYVDSPRADDNADVPAGKVRGDCCLGFEVGESAEYALWARVRTPPGGRGGADSFFVTMDGDRPIAWHIPAGEEWQWAPVSSGAGRSPVTFRLDAGKHEVTLQTREPGAQVDCVLLTRDGQPFPPLPAMLTGDGTPLFLEAECGRVSPPMRITRSVVPAPRLVVRIHADGDAKLSTDVFRPVDHHPPAAFPRLRATVRSGNPRFIAVLLPLPPGVAEPDVRFETDPGRRVATITWADHADTLAWSVTDGAVEFTEPPASRPRGTAGR
jgi:hypothetical protein